MAMTILYLIGSLFLVVLGVTFYSVVVSRENHWRELAMIFAVTIMVFGISNLIYLIISRFLM